jgi:Ala-tRNA(Pro) deacylase
LSKTCVSTCRNGVEGILAPVDRVKRFLDEQGIRYETLPHREVFTSQEVAAASHVPGLRLAKVVVAREDGGRYLMAVLPAPCRLDLAALREVAGTGRLSLASEEEMGRLFPDCEVGAMPPFGNLYGVPVYVDHCFPHAQEFVFQAGTHHEVVRVRYEEYERAVRPVVGEFCTHAREKRPAA